MILGCYEPSLSPSFITEAVMDELFYPTKIDVLRILPLINTHAKDLYLVLCAHADFKTGVCWPSYRTILKLTKIDNGKHVKKAIDHLVGLGLIETWKVGKNRRYKVL